MTTIAVDSRTFHLRVPVLWLGRVRGNVVVRITEEVELTVHRHEGRRRPSRATSRAAVERADAHRTAALGQRLPGF